MIVNLSGARIVTVTPAVTKTISTLTILSELDDSLNKKVIVRTKEIGAVTIWEGDAYDAAGNWTDQMVSDRLKEIYDK